MKCFKSLSSRLKLLTVLWVTAAVGSIVLTLLLSWRLEGGAAAINDAGSLRMQTYRLGLLLRETDNQAEVDDRIRHFDETLYTLQAGDPARPLFLPDTPEVHQHMAQLQQRWQQQKQQKQPQQVWSHCRKQSEKRQQRLQQQER